MLKNQSVHKNKFYKMTILNCFKNKKILNNLIKSNDKLYVVFVSASLINKIDL